MAQFKAFIISMLILNLTTDIMCKIVLPHKLRYLENMLHSEVVAKAARIRQRLETNPNTQDTVDTKSWPLLLAKYGQDEPKATKDNGMTYNVYDRRAPNFKYHLPANV